MLDNQFQKSDEFFVCPYKEKLCIEETIFPCQYVCIWQELAE